MFDYNLFQKRLDEARSEFEKSLSSIENDFFKEEGGLFLINNDTSDPKKKRGESKYGIGFCIDISKIKD